MRVSPHDQQIIVPMLELIVESHLLPDGSNLHDFNLQDMRLDFDSVICKVR
jgi:hypothetical protein